LHKFTVNNIYLQVAQQQQFYLAFDDLFFRVLFFSTFNCALNYVAFVSSSQRFVILSSPRAVLPIVCVRLKIIQMSDLLQNVEYGCLLHFISCTWEGRVCLPTKSKNSCLKLQHI